MKLPKNSDFSNTLLTKRPFIDSGLLFSIDNKNPQSAIEINS